MMARYAVVIAKLLLPLDSNPKHLKQSSDKKYADYGPHAFLIDMNDTPVHREDMKRKTGFNGLDNAILTFDQALAPHEALLDQFSSVDQKGSYKLADPNVPFRFEHVV